MSEEQIREGLLKNISYNSEINYYNIDKDFINDLEMIKIDKDINEKNILMDDNKLDEVNCKKDVFVTYSWDNDEHKAKVIEFVNFLRTKGYLAEMDELLIQEQSSIDFNVMMHSGFSNYKKVIVILSKGYKKKAENFSGGVGKEYRLLMQDILTNENKYILVSFDEINPTSINEILPLWLSGRYIIDLKNDQEDNFKKLFSKLSDKKIYKFSDVASNKEDIQTKEIGEFKL